MKYFIIMVSIVFASDEKTGLLKSNKYPSNLGIEITELPKVAIEEDLRCLKCNECGDHIVHKDCCSSIQNCDCYESEEEYMGEESIEQKEKKDLYKEMFVL